MQEKRKGWIVFVSVLIISLMLISIATIAVFGYNTTINESMSMIVTTTQIGVGFAGADYQWFNSTDYTVRTFTVSKNVTIPDLDMSNYSIYFDDMGEDLSEDLIKLFSNLSVNVPNSLQENINTTIRTAVLDSLEAKLVGLGNDIVARTNSHASLLCNVDSYKTFIHQELTEQILPNLTAYENTVSSLEQCSASLSQKNLDYIKLDEDYKDLKYTDQVKTIIIFVLFAVILFILWMDYGSGGSDSLRKLRWKKTERQALNNSTYKEVNKDDGKMPEMPNNNKENKEL